MKQERLDVRDTNYFVNSNPQSQASTPDKSGRGMGTAKKSGQICFKYQGPQYLYSKADMTLTHQRGGGYWNILISMEYPYFKSSKSATYNLLLEKLKLKHTKNQLARSSRLIVGLSHHLIFRSSLVVLLQCKLIFKKLIKSFRTSLI